MTLSMSPVMNIVKKNSISSVKGVYLSYIQNHAADYLGELSDYYMKIIAPRKDLDGKF